MTTGAAATSRCARKYTAAATRSTYHADKKYKEAVTTVAVEKRAPRTCASPRRRANNLFADFELRASGRRVAEQPSRTRAPGGSFDQRPSRMARRRFNSLRPGDASDVLLGRCQHLMIEQKPPPRSQQARKAFRAGNDSDDAVVEGPQDLDELGPYFLYWNDSRGEVVITALEDAPAAPF